jgi:ring-1,2-phenylacetyl-CoA epoxidase subunit PaaD
VTSNEPGSTPAAGPPAGVRARAAAAAVRPARIPASRDALPPAATIGPVATSPRPAGLPPGSLARARAIAASVPDPELPVLTLGDLGVLRGVTDDAGRIVVSLTPTYSGCPALREMRGDLACRLTAAGFGAVEIRTVLSPAWSSDWITAEGRRKLAAAGIAPPGPAPARAAGAPVPLTLAPPRPGPACPSCGSPDTTLTAAFSATACKDLYRCRACAEPFEHVKEI